MVTLPAHRLPLHHATRITAARVKDPTLPLTPGAIRPPLFGALLIQCDGLLARLQRLTERAEATNEALGSDVMSFALEGYALLKLSGRNRGLEGLRRELSGRFAKGGRAPEPAANPTAATQVIRKAPVAQAAGVLLALDHQAPNPSTRQDAHPRSHAPCRTVDSHHSNPRREATQAPDVACYRQDHRLSHGCSSPDGDSRHTTAACDF
jgi:hypothetical protein